MAEFVSNYDDLIKRCINREEKARKELYDLFAIPMYNICLRFANDKSEAEDIYQEAFIKVFENLVKLKNRNLLPGWIKRIFVNTAIDALRNKKAEIVSLDDVEDTTNTSSILDNMYTEEILNLIQNLPTRTRTIFMLYVIEGFSHKEIAEIMEIDIGTSKSQLFDAKKKLRSLIRKTELTSSQLNTIPL